MENIEENCNNDENTNRRRSTRRSVLQSKQIITEEQEYISSEDEMVFETTEKHKFEEPFDGDMDVDGKAVFAFHTPKKKDSMASVAASVCTPKTPKAAKTPDSKRNKIELAPKTPKHIRNKVKKEISKITAEDSTSDFSADESDYEPNNYGNSQSDDSESFVSEDEDQLASYRRQIIVPILPETPTSKVLKTKSLRKNTRATQDYIPESDEYFQTHHSNKFVTSDHTLERLKNPRLPADRLFSLLSELKVSPEHEEAVSNIIDEYKTYFTKWLYLLNEGFNILLYGLGSKRNLLQEFHREVLSNQNVIIINGFFPSLTIKDILTSISNDVLDLSSVTGSPHDVVNMIEEELSYLPESHIYLIVHNIDGAMLRNSKSQEILSRLAKIPNIHFIASIDHINTPLIWNQRRLSDYNFSWWDCTTMLPYIDETASENSIMVQNTGELALSSMRNVFQSLTQNAKGIYLLIVKYQLKYNGNPNYQGMIFKDLYWSSREAFLVSSDLVLRAQLTEFLDHKMVKNKRNIDGAEHLQIPIDCELLQQFLDEHENRS
ncbi:ORC2 family protein [Megaselia abdita]